MNICFWESGVLSRVMKIQLVSSKQPTWTALVCALRNGFKRSNHSTFQKYHILCPLVYTPIQWSRWRSETLRRKAFGCSCKVSVICVTYFVGILRKTPQYIWRMSSNINCHENPSSGPELFLADRETEVQTDKYDEANRCFLQFLLTRLKTRACKDYYILGCCAVNVGRYVKVKR
jgi:hypothetical protein